MALQILLWEIDIILALLIIIGLLVITEATRARIERAVRRKEK